MPITTAAGAARIFLPLVPLDSAASRSLPSWLSRLLVGRGRAHLHQIVDRADVGLGDGIAVIAVGGARGAEDRVEGVVVEWLGHDVVSRSVCPE
jgi:hypothetical protein